MQPDRIKVLITSVGTASAISVIKALKRQNEIPLEIFATDMDPLAAGLFLADHYFISPSAKDPGYIPSLIEAIRKYRIQAIIPIHSKEMSLVSHHADEFEANGAGTFLPSPSSIDLCNDKVAIANLLKESGVTIPKQYLKPSAVTEDDFPVFFKPNFSSSSTGASIVNNAAELENAFNSCSNGVIQELIKGQEITVDVFCNTFSIPLVISPRTRISVKSGQSVKGETIAPDLFRDAVIEVCSLVKMKGACNIQFFLQNDKPVFIEINPRFAAGGLMLTVAAGANIPLLVLSSILKMPISASDCQVKTGLKMTRYWEEIFV